MAGFLISANFSRSCLHPHPGFELLFFSKVSTKSIMVLQSAIQRVINLVQIFRTEYARQENDTLQKDFKISLGRTPVFTLQWRPVIGFRGVASIAVQQQLHCLHSKVDSYETVAAGSELDRLPILLIFLCVIYSRPCILRKSTSK